MSPTDAPEPVDAKERLEALRRAFEGRDRILVLTHDNPDPDALASGFALAAVLEHAIDSECVVGYAGIIGRAENRAMVRELELKPRRIARSMISDFDGVALVDTQPGFGNNSLPEDVVATAVIDHHPRRGTLDDVTHVDVREGYGASATILYEYAQTSGVPLPGNLLTALFYAIKSETQELGREAGYADREAYLSLLPRADKEAVARIQRASVPRDYFRAFQVGIDSACIYGHAVIADLREVGSPDMVAEIADFLLRLEGADWTFCMGLYQSAMVMSVRTSENDAHAGTVIREVVAGHGRAGGHGTMAGGQIPLADHDYDEVVELVSSRLLEKLGIDEQSGQPLVAE